jgi:hypothetical protein
MFHDVYASDLSGQVVNGLSGYWARIQHASRNHLISCLKKAHHVTDAFGIYAKDKHGCDPSLKLQWEHAQNLLINENKYIHNGKVVNVGLHNLRGTLTDIDILQGQFVVNFFNLTILIIALDATYTGPWTATYLKRSFTQGLERYMSLYGYK